MRELVKEIRYLICDIELESTNNSFRLFKVNVDSRKLPVVGLEPTRGCPQKILSLPRLPFRHTG